MRIAALILAHHQPSNLHRLLKRLTGPLWKCYVHVDRKSNIVQFKDVAEGAQFLVNRAKVYWGSMSVVDATLALLRTAVQDPEVTHFYLMSGQCYPLLSDEDIQSRILALPTNQSNLITVTAMPSLSKPIERLSRWHVPSMRPEMLRKVFQRILFLLPPREIRDMLYELQPYAGAQWWLLNREAVTAILRFLETHAWFERAFRFSHCADEMFFQTAFVGLGLQAGGEAPTAAKWTGKRNPEVVNSVILEELGSGPALFARKFDRFYPSDC